MIPQKYARVLVRALYVDSIDFDLVDDRSVEIGDRYNINKIYQFVLKTSKNQSDRSIKIKDY